MPYALRQFSAEATELLVIYGSWIWPKFPAVLPPSLVTFMGCRVTVMDETSVQSPNLGRRIFLTHQHPTVYTDFTHNFCGNFIFYLFFLRRSVNLRRRFCVWGFQVWSHSVPRKKVSPPPTLLEEQERSEWGPLKEPTEWGTFTKVANGGTIGCGWDNRD